MSKKNNSNNNWSPKVNSPRNATQPRSAFTPSSNLKDLNKPSLITSTPAAILPKIELSSTAPANSNDAPKNNEQLEILKGENRALQAKVEELQAKVAKYESENENFRQQIIAEIQADEVAIRQEHFQQKQAEIETLHLEAHRKNDSAQKNLQDVETQIKRKIEDARKYYQKLLEQAQQEVALVKPNAQKEAEKILEQAHQQAEQVLEQRLQELEKREAELKRQNRNLRGKEQELADREEDLAESQQLLKKEQAAVAEKWQLCAPERVRNLEHELEILRGYQKADNDLITKLQAEKVDLETKFRVTSRSPQELLTELERERQRNIELSNQLADYPSKTELERLRQEASSVLQLEAEVRDWKARDSESKRRANNLTLQKLELESVSAQTDALRIINTDLRRELDSFKESLQQTNERFAALLQLDNFKPSRLTNSTVGKWNEKDLLKNLAQHVKDFAAQRSNNRPALGYSLNDIRTFIAGLASSHLLILQGLSGTGKTSLPRVFSEAIGGNYELIPVQSSWRDRHELLGYNNDFSKRFNETEFTKAVYKAGLPNQQQNVWFIVLDEMNLARVEYYFADFLSILEEPDNNKWLVSLLSSDPRIDGKGGPQHLVDGSKLRVPSNLWFIGTANQDESTFEITDKIYDRAQVMDFKERQNAPDNQAKQSLLPEIVNCTSLQKAFDEAKQDKIKQLTSDDLDFLEILDDGLLKRFGITFGNRIIEQLKIFVPIFVAAGGRKEEAIDIQLAYKVLRKLENRHDYNMGEILRTFEKDYLDAAKPTNWQPLSISKKLIKTKIQRMGGEQSAY